MSLCSHAGGGTLAEACGRCVILFLVSFIQSDKFKLLDVAQQISQIFNKDMTQIESPTQTRMWWWCYDAVKAGSVAVL